MYILAKGKLVLDFEQKSKKVSKREIRGERYSRWHCASKKNLWAYFDSFEGRLDRDNLYITEEGIKEILQNKIKELQNILHKELYKDLYVTDGISKLNKDTFLYKAEYIEDLLNDNNIVSICRGNRKKDGIKEMGYESLCEY